MDGRKGRDKERDKEMELSDVLKLDLLGPQAFVLLFSSLPSFLSFATFMFFVS